MMAPLRFQRAGWLLFVLVVAFGGWIGSAAQAQDAPKKNRITRPPRTTTQPRRHLGSRPAKEETPLATYPATQEARERYQQYQEMKDAAERNGHAREDEATTQPTTQATSQPDSAPVEGAVPATPEERAKRMEEARRRAIESAQHRQVGRDVVKPERGADEDQPRPISPPYGTSQWESPTVPAHAMEEAEVVEPIRADVMPEEVDEDGTPAPVADETVPPPARRAGRQPAVEPPPAEATEVKEPNVVVTPVEPGGREYFISFKQTPWEDVIRYYQQLVGKPLMGEDMAPVGDLTYESKRRFTRDEMRDELNFLLLERNVFIVEREDYLYIVPTSEISKFITLDHVFPSIAAFDEADLRPLEICEVLIQIKDRPAKDVQDALAPSMPDYAIPVVVGEANQIKLTGLAQDVRRFMDLNAMMDREKFDPRETRFIKVETNVRDVESMLRQYLGTQPATRRYDREQRRFVTEGGDSKVLIIPDERTKTLIVKATPAELKEIEDFVKLIDQRPDIGDFKTNVLPVQYGNASEIARLLNEILQQEQGEQRRSSIQIPQRTRTTTRDPRTGRVTQQQVGSAAPEDIIVEDLYERAKKTVRIIAEERTNNLVVYANEDGLKRVREILEQIDVPVPTNYRTFTLEHAKPSQIQPTIEQIARGMSGGNVRGAAGVTIIADDGLNALHVIADREDMTRIEKIIKDFDIEIPEDEWHIVQLKNITASDAARKIAPFLDTSGAAAATRRPTRGRRMSSAPGPAAPTAQVIPLDESATLIVICSEEEWTDVEKVLQIADEQALTDRPEIRFFEVTNGNPESIAETVNQLYANYQHPVLGRTRTFVDTLDNQIVVQAVKPALEEIESLIKTLDVKVEGQPLVILPLVNADAQDVLQQIQPLLGTGGRPQRGRFGGGASAGGNSVQADPMTNSLIVQADPTTLERIKNYVTLYEQQVASQTPERKTYTLKYATARDVVNAINSFFGSGRGGRYGRQSAGSRVNAVVVGSQVIVDAPADKQREVEALINELDSMSDQGVTALLIKLPGADIRSIAQHLNNAFIDRVRTQGAVARFEPDLTTETILMTCSKDILPEAEDLLNKYKELTSEQVWQTETYQLKHANANDTANWLNTQLASLLSQTMPQNVVRLIRVTPDMRTNRLFINAPQLAVKQGLQLLEMYDTPAEQQIEAPVEIWTEKLPGLDVRALASQLQRNVDELMRARTDRARAVVTADQLTNNLIITAPTDMKAKIAELIAQFSAETADLEIVQQIIDVKNADANYIASQLRNILSYRIGNKRGSGVAQQLNFQVDTRLNRVIMNAPKLAVDEALALAAELDKESDQERPIQTLPLLNADANTVNSVLQNIYNEKIRARTLQITIEPLTNSLIVSATKSDFEDIKSWVEEFDEGAKDKTAPPEIIDFKNANPWEVLNVLNATFMQKSYGRKVQPGQEIKMSVIAGRSIVVQAPPNKLEEIKALAAKLDEVGQNEAVMRIIQMPGLGSSLTQLAQQIQAALNQRVSGRENRPSVTAYPPAEALIVSATPQQFTLVDQVIEQFKPLMQERPLRTIPLTSTDANTINGVLQQIFGDKLRAGMMRISVEPLTNSLIVSAPQADFDEIKTWIEEIDLGAKDKISPPEVIDFKYANPWEALNVLNATFMQKSYGRKVQPGQEIKMSVVGGRSIVVQAPPDKLAEIKELAAKLDEIGAIQAEIRVYEMPGLGSNLNQFAQQIQQALNQQITGRENRPSVTAYPPADSLIVSATPHQFEMVEAAIDKLKPIMEIKKAKTEIFKLQHVDAGSIAGMVQNLVQTKLQVVGGSSRGSQGFSVTPDSRTNRLIVFAPESVMPEVRDIVQQFDVPVTDDNVVTIQLKYADPWETRNMINDIFGGQTRRGGDAQSEQVYVTVSNNTLIVKAPPKKLEKIHDLLAKIDVEDMGGLQIKTYQLKILNAQTVAVQVQMFLNSLGKVQKRGQMQPGAFAEPTTNTLVVIAPTDKLPFIETLITGIEAQGDEPFSIESYVLKNIRADQAQRHIDQMLKAKILEIDGPTRGRTIQQITTVLAEPESNRLFVSAPEKYQSLTAEMIALIDQEVELGDIVHIIRLENAEAASLAQTVTQTLQSGAGGRNAAPLRVKIVADAGSNSILLSGLPKDVADAENLIKDLEVTYDTIPELRYFTLQFAQGYEVAEALKNIFPAGRNPADNVTVTEDDYYTDKLLVTANRRKMRQVEAVINQLDQAPDQQESPFGNGREIYFVDLSRGDASDIVWDLEELLPPPEKGGPKFDYDIFDSSYIQVICKPNDFDRVLKLIRQFEKKAKIETVVRSRSFRQDPATLVRYLKDRDIPVELETQELPQERESIIIELHPDKIRQKETDRARDKDKSKENNKGNNKESGKPSPISWLDEIQPYIGVGKAPPLFGGVILTTLLPTFSTDFDEQDPPAAAAKPDAPEERKAAPVAKPQPPAPSPKKDEPPAADKETETTEGTTYSAEYYDSLKEPPQRERATLQVLPDRRIIMRGPRNAVDELEDAIDLFEEDLSRGEVIRIFRFCCGDVNAASRILDMMFNDTRIRVPQQMQRQQGQQPGQPGRPGQQPGQPGQGRGGEDEQQDPRQAAMQMMQEMMGQRSQGGESGGGKGVRIATDASHNYIIVKCDESLLPDIIQLLAELDIEPSEVDIQVIQLKNLDASETANNIKEILSGNVSGSSQARRTQLPQGRGNPQQQLMEMLQQQMVSIGDGVSAKTESVSVVPNGITNSLLVSAPRDMMKIITNIIEQLEALEGGDITVIERYKVLNAKVDDILPLLQEIFSAAGSTRGGGGPRGGGSSPAELGPVTLSGDPRDNTIIFVAQAKDVKTVREQIEKLDFAGAVAEIEMYICKYGDAESIAAVVEEMFATGAIAPGSGRRGRMGGGATVTSGSNLEVRITAESATNTILVYGPEDKRKLILEQIEKLDRQNRFEIREIPLQYAKTDDVADTLLQIFGGSGGSALTASGQGGRRGGARNQVTQTSGRIVIVPDENAKKLLVRAPDEIFVQMVELAAVLDQPSQNLQIKTYPLKHADAATVVDSVKAALSEYLQLSNVLGGQKSEFDAFTAMPDTRTNSVIVVGSPETFVFVENVINAIDGEIPADREKQFQIYVLDRADAQVVADAINSFAGSQATSGGARSMGRRGGFTPSASVGAGGSGLDVQAVADTSTNSVMVYGRPQDILKVEMEVIDKLEDAIISSRQFATIQIKEAVPTQLITYIQPFLDDTAGFRGDTGGSGRRSGGIDTSPGPRLIGNDNNGTIVVYGSERQIEEVRALIERFDSKDTTSTNYAIIPVPFGQDPFAMASLVQDLVNNSQQMIAEKTGRQPSLVTVSADEHSNAIIAFGESAQLAVVKTVVTQLQEIRPERPVTRVLELVNLSSAEAQQLIEDLQQSRSGGGGRSSTTGSYQNSPRRRTSTPSQPRSSGGTPGSSRRRISGGRSWNWNPTYDAPRFSIHTADVYDGEIPAGCVVPASETDPFIGMTALLPQLKTVLVMQVSHALIAAYEQQDQDPPAKENPKKQAPPGRAKEPRKQPSAKDQPPAGPQPAERKSQAQPAPRQQPSRGEKNTDPRSQALLDQLRKLEQEQKRVAAESQPPAEDKPSRGRRSAGDEQPPAEEPQELSPRLQEQQALLSSVTGQLRGDVIATPIDSRRIIITGDQNDVDFIIQMLQMMEGSTPQAVIEVFSLQNAKAAVVGPAIEEILTKLIAAQGGGSDRVDQFSIVAEARSNSLIVAASETNMDKIAELIDKLDVDTMSDTRTTIVPLKHIRASEAATLLEQAIQKLNQIRDIPANAQPTIQAVERSNAIQIVGTPADIAEIERMIEGIDVELPPEDDFTTALVTIIELKNAVAEDLADTLTELIEMEKLNSTGGGGAKTNMPLLRKLILKTADGRELPPLDLDKPIAFFAEKGKNALVIFSSDKNSESLKEIVNLFDSLPLGNQVEVKSFALKFANAEETAKLLQDMFDDSKKALKRAAEGDSQGMEKGVMPPVPPGLAGQGLPYNVVVTHDVRTNTIIVIGHKDSVLLAAGIVSEIDVPSTEFNLKAYVLQLKNIQATQLQEDLDELLSKRLDALGGDKNQARDGAILRADSRSNSLIVIAAPEVFEIVKDLAGRLDQTEAYNIVDGEFRRLNYADAAKLAAILQEYFDKKKDANRDVVEQGQKDILTVFADARSNGLLMTGTRDFLVEANRLIDNLDQAFDPTVQFKVRPVLLNSAANIAQLLQDMVDKSREQQDSDMRGTPIHIAADPYSNNLLLAAAAEDMVMVERWIDVLDRPAEPGRVVRIIPIARGKAQDVSKSAEDMFKAQAQGADADLTVTYDETTNAVIAIGPPAVVKDIESYLNDLNSVEGPGAIVRIFKLDQANAEDAGNLVRSILEGKGGSVGGGSRGGGSGGEEFNQVMLIFQAEHPEVGFETLKAMRKEIVVIDDLRTNSLVVTAPPESMPMMASLVQAIDVPPAAANIRIFKLRNSDAEEMVTKLKELFESQQSGRSSSSSSNTDQIEYQFSLGDLVPGGRQQISFTSDTRTNSIIAAGTPGYLDLVEQLVIKLDSEPIEERKTIVFQPGNNPAVAIQQAISEYNDAEQQRLNELQDQISPSKRMERTITAIASEDTNRIVLDYDPRREEDVLNLLQDLDQPPPQVMIQVLIVEVTMDNSLELGVEFAFQDLQYTKAGTTDTNTFDFVGGTDIGAAGTGLGGFTFTVTGADFNFLVRTLQNEGNLNILSRPQIVAMDNQEASIEITNDVPYPAGTTTGVGGVISTNVQRKDVGIKLIVTPHINTDGFVRMEIEQEVSDITSSTVDIGQGLTSPIFFKRNAKTVVTVKDDETVVLGGLITTRDEVREQKIPVLGDIPVLGLLFSNRSNETKRTELLVVLTPRVVRSVEEYRELSIQERDHTGKLPDKVLTDELMNGLRVAPENLQPAVRTETISPKPREKAKIEPRQAQPEPEPADDEEYGPQLSRSTSSDASGDAMKDENQDSYDVPLSWASDDAAWSRRRMEYR